MVIYIYNWNEYRIAFMCVCVTHTSRVRLLFGFQRHFRSELNVRTCCMDTCCAVSGIYYVNINTHTVEHALSSGRLGYRIRWWNEHRVDEAKVVVYGYISQCFPSTMYWQSIRRRCRCRQFIMICSIPTVQLRPHS